MSKKQYTHKRLDELFEEIRIYYAGIVMDLEERLANPLKQFGSFGNPVKATAAKNLKNQEDCLAALDSFGLAESKRLFALTKTHHTDPHVFKSRKDFAHEFHKILTSVFQETGKTLPDTPCYKLPRVANLMQNKRTGKTSYDIDAISSVVSEYKKHEHRDKVSSPKYHPPPPPGDNEGGMGENPYTKHIAKPHTEKPFLMPAVAQPPTGFSNAAASAVKIGGHRRTRRHNSRRRKTARKQ
jgi:hypothetical protein